MESGMLRSWSRSSRARFPILPAVDTDGIAEVVTEICGFDETFRGCHAAETTRNQSREPTQNSRMRGQGIGAQVGDQPGQWFANRQFQGIEAMYADTKNWGKSRHPNGSLQNQGVGNERVGAIDPNGVLR